MLSSNNQAPKLCVAVINFNGAASLMPTLQSVYALEQVQLERVMLLDNASSDDSIAIVRRHFPQVEICALADNRGPNPARNLALRQAPTDLVLIMDNDIILEPTYAAVLAQVFRAQPNVAAAGGQIRLQAEPDIIQYNGVDIHYAGEIAARDSARRDTLKVSCLSAGATLFDRPKALAVGGFDDDFFFGWEDGDLTFRLSLSGYSCYMVSGTAGYHMRQARGLKWVRYQTRNRWWFMLKNYDPGTFWLALPAVLCLQAGAGLFCLCQGQARAFLQGTLEAWAAWPALRRKRAAILTLKKISDRELLCGKRFDLPGGLGRRGAGRLLNIILNKLFYGYWLGIRPLLRRRPTPVA